MSELSQPPFSAAVGDVRDQQGRLLGQVRITNSAWTIFLNGVYERIGSLQAPSATEIVQQVTQVENNVTVVQGDISTLETNVEALQTQVTGLADTVQQPYEWAQISGPPWLSLLTRLEQRIADLEQLLLARA